MISGEATDHLAHTEHIPITCDIVALGACWNVMQTIAKLYIPKLDLSVIRSRDLSRQAGQTGKQEVRA
jgi:hypothetical protein